MLLARFATITTPKEPGLATDHILRVGDYQIDCIRQNASTGSFTRLIACSTRFRTLPQLNGDRMLLVSKQVREGAEEVIEHYGNLISVATCTPRVISSTMPCLALQGETDAERELLTSAIGIHVEPTVRCLAGIDTRLDITPHLTLLAPRLDGVAILAEALSHDRVSARFRDCIRLFERAFTLGGRALISPLGSFLATGPGNYSRDEVKRWIEIRDGVTHADRKKTLFDADVFHVVERTTQAAYDVLLNKAGWKDAGHKRRDPSWRPACGITDRAGTSVWATQGEEMRTTMRIFDEYGRFPLNVEGALTATPDGWWVGKQSSARELPEVPDQLSLSTNL